MRRYNFTLGLLFVIWGGIACTQQEVVPTPVPEAELAEILEKAHSFTSSNDEWAPVIQEFDGIQMVLVPAGCFMMGSEERKDERPMHEFCFEEPFWMDRFEVTNAQFVEFLNAEGNRSRDRHDWLVSDGESVQIQQTDEEWQVDAGFDNHPVVQVTWYGARDYCLWRGGRPVSEAQWEYSARGPDGLIYPWGDEFDGAQTNFCDRNCTLDWADDAYNDGYETTAPVGNYKDSTSWVGAYDMSGNVWEWVSSVYKEYPYRLDTGDTRSGFGREDLFPVSFGGTVDMRARRGGSFTHEEDDVRTANRNGGAPDAYANDMGIRCARTIEQDSTPLLHSLEEHRQTVVGVAFSPDGAQVLSGSRDSTLKLWDVETGELLQTLKGHRGGVASVAFSPDGATVLSGGAYNESAPKLWDVTTGALLQTFEGHSTIVQSVAFSPNGATVLSGSADKTMKLWDVSTGALLNTIDGHIEAVRDGAFSPDDEMVLSSSADSTMKLWDVTTGALLHTFEDDEDTVFSVAFSPDGEIVLSGSGDNTLKLWDVATGELLRTFEDHQDSVLSVAFSPDGTQALSGSADNTLKLWDVETGELLYTFRGHTEDVFSVAFSPDGLTIASGSADETLKLWDAAAR